MMVDLGIEVLHVLCVYGIFPDRGQCLLDNSFNNAILLHTSACNLIVGPGGLLVF